MKIWNSLTQAKEELIKANANTVLTIGNFDGIHRGHQAIIKRVVELAQGTKSISVVFTFVNHTESLFGQPPQLLNQPMVRWELLSKFGLDILLEVEFTPKIAALDPEEFFRNWLVDGLKTSKIIVGHDFRFGSKGRGNFQLLRNLGIVSEIAVEQILPVREGGEIISSSKIRQLIAEGEISLANRMLGYPFTVIGKVVKGEQRGRLLGFPTVNIQLAPEYLLPAYGVYLVSFLVDEQTFYGVANVGVKPTFGVNAPLIEVHLFDMTLDLYDKRVRVSFLDFIRAESRFRNAAELTIQIQNDVKTARGLLFKNDYSGE